ncbi:MAG: signal recognition particle-docking protein FtsY [Armatimonadota bacterium]
MDTIREEQYSRMRLFGALKNIARKLTGKTVLDEDTAEELEEALIGADVAYETVTKILQRLHDSKAHPEGVEAGLREIICELMGADGPQGLVYGPQPPTVIFVAGVNGVGKTTTIAKLAHLYRREGKRVLLCAADTFRAAAIEQLEIWAGRVGADIVKGQPGADPAAVVFDGINAARARGADVVIVDTAGRLHTKSNLMEELRKIVRTVEKTAGRPPDETLLVLDATTGQNAIAQAREFLNAINVTGLVLSKMDSSARGGTVLSIRDELGVPVRYIGTGEKVEDLELFDPREFARQLLEG